jgi:hypothetical protein
VNRPGHCKTGKKCRQRVLNLLQLELHISIRPLWLPFRGEIAKAIAALAAVSRDSDF